MMMGKMGLGVWGWGAVGWWVGCCRRIVNISVRPWMSSSFIVGRVVKGPKISLVVVSASGEMSDRLYPKSVRG